MILIADTSGLLAAHNTTDREHQRARQALDQAALVVISPHVITEIHQVASSRAGRRVADALVRDVLAEVRGTRAVVPEITYELLDTAVTVRGRYQNLDLDLTDVVCVVLAAEYATDAVLTLDRRDFRCLRPLSGHKAFWLLPDDLPN